MILDVFIYLSQHYSRLIAEDKNLCDDPYLNICAFIAKNEASQNITPISVLGKDGCIRGENDKYRCLCSKGFEEVNGVCVGMLSGCFILFEHVLLIFLLI